MGCASLRSTRRRKRRHRKPLGSAFFVGCGLGRNLRIKAAKPMKAAIWPASSVDNGFGEPGSAVQVPDCRTAEPRQTVRSRLADYRPTQWAARWASEEP